jgi:(p)ppGpp synthase/HD superfamily hydrolase
MDDPEVINFNRFCKRLERSLTGTEAALVLKAHHCAVKGLGTGQAEDLHAADVLLRYHAEPMVVAAALLVSVRRDGIFGPDEIRSMFGDAILGLVEGAVAEQSLRTNRAARPGERLRAFLESISQNLRHVILHLGLRLAELETLASLENGDRRAIARESLDLYVPLADRMGMGLLRSALEDVCLRILEPSIYEELVQGLAPIQAEDEACLVLLTEGIQGILERNGIKGIVHGRTKGLYSLYHKMCCRERPLYEIMDRIGLRIIVSAPEECYMVLGLLHTHFRPIPGTFDDYIGLPKENGYRSLHTCIYPVPDFSYKPVEIQIRTEVMHQEALFGIAAHWRYKIEEEATQAHQGQLRWLHSLLAQHAEAVDHAEFIELLRRQVFSDNLLVLNEAGQQIWLPEGALVRDFERLVSAAENDCVVRVNGRIRPRDHALRDGDTVELVRRGDDAILRRSP